MRLFRAWLLPLAVLVVLLGTAWPADAASRQDQDRWLNDRLAAWPTWQLPAPLPRPGHSDLIYPAWFEGDWRAQLHDPSGASPDQEVVVRFVRRGDGAVVGDRAFNAAAIGRAVLGSELLSVRDDPRNPNRQISNLSADRQLETTVVGRRQTSPDPDTLLADELSLQVVHAGGDPRVSRVETLSRYRRVSDDRIEGEQWQASYPSPALGLGASAQRSWQGCLALTRVRDGQPQLRDDPAS